MSRLGVTLYHLELEVLRLSTKYPRIGVPPSEADDCHDTTHDVLRMSLMLTDPGELGTAVNYICI